ncbi:MAG: AAA family ATPase, partial [Dehalococcoidales bacterium]|nr:AAA family ATPase [Dehalococcoidales bacterium]
MSKELKANEVRLRCDPLLFNCESTEELQPKEGIIGQDRALTALKFGVNILKSGFNIYVSGLAGTGKTTAIKPFLETLAAKKAIPSDWCYVHNFHDAYCPRALEMPSGMGQSFQKDMKRIIENAGRSLVQAFTSKEY